MAHEATAAAAQVTSGARDTGVTVVVILAALGVRVVVILAALGVSVVVILAALGVRVVVILALGV